MKEVKDGKYIKINERKTCKVINSNKVTIRTYRLFYFCKSFDDVIFANKCTCR